MRVVSGGVGSEGAGGAVLKTLVDGEDHKLAGAAELAVHENAGEVGFGSGIVALVMRQNLFNPLRNNHLCSTVLKNLAACNA